MIILDLAKEILEKINNLGYLAYIVGGAVRDFLLNEETNDIDISTNMPLEEIENHFSILDNGSDYQSVTIIYKGNSFEITHFRRDLSYKDHRHPMVLTVNTYLEDSSRRDFTINALAMDKNGQILDFYDGMKDLEDKVIKAIGDPFLRFEEDSLRILRGLYFSSKLGFDIDSDTLFAMVDKKELLKELSEERIYQYFVKILYAKTDKGIRYINELDLFQYIPTFKRWLNIVSKDMKEEDLILYYYGKLKKFPIKTKKEVLKKAKALDLLKNNLNSYTLYKNKEIYFEIRDILKYFGCDIIGADKLVENLVIKEDKDLALTKEEISSMFVGKEKSVAIEKVLEGILNGKIKNTKDDILKLLGRV